MHIAAAKREVAYSCVNIAERQATSHPLCRIQVEKPHVDFRR